MKEFYEQPQSQGYIKHAFLIPGSPVVKTDVEVDTGSGTAVAGTVLAVKTSNGKVTLYKKTGSDGENVARYILATDVLDFAEDKNTMVYDMGTFVMDGLIFPADITSDADKTKMKKDLEQHKIYLRRTMI